MRYQEYRTPNWFEYEYVLERVTEPNAQHELQYASDELKDNENIVRGAVLRWWGAIQYASNRLRNKKEIALIAVNGYSCYKLNDALSMISLDLKNDFDVVLMAVKRDGLALRHASEEMRDHAIIIMEAIKKNPMALQYASEKMRDNLEIVTEVEKSSRYALNFASQRLRNAMGIA